MRLLNEHVYTVNSVDLTDHQKIVLAKAFQAGGIDGEMKHVELGDEKLTAARDILNDLDLLSHEYASDTMTVTQPGIEALKRDGIIDDSDNLTDIGQQYAQNKIPAENTGEQTPPSNESITFAQYLRLLASD